MGSWLGFLDEVQQAARGVAYPFYRGSPAQDHQLLPSLFRVRRKKYAECNVFYDFFSYAKPLLNTQALSPIETLFEMRHAGIPTRLLDWTTTFAVALYFAVGGKCETPCIWVLDPGELNFRAIGYDLLVQSDAVEYDHESSSVKYDGKVLEYPLAIFPTMQSSRIFAQKGHFTIHGILEEEIEKLCPGCVTRLPIPLDLLGDARRFLQLSGINEYSVFPDIDGLARLLIKEHGLDRRRDSYQREKEKLE